MTTDPLNLAAFTVFVFITVVGGVALSATFWRAMTSIHKESTMSTLSTNPGHERRASDRAAYAARSRFLSPTRELFDNGDPLDFDFVAMDATVTRAAAVKRITSAPRIQWCLLTDAEIEHIAATCPSSMKDRALNARSKRARRRANEARRALRGDLVSAAKGGGAR